MTEWLDFWATRGPWQRAGGPYDQGRWYEVLSSPLIIIFSLFKKLDVFNIYLEFTEKNNNLFYLFSNKM